jgi:hypothetical protein
MLAAERGASIIGAVLISGLAVIIYLLQRYRRRNRKAYENLNNTNNSVSHIQEPSARPYNEEQHKIAERSFWKRQSRSAKYLNIITLVAALVGLMSLYFIRQQLIDAKEATIRANRAWLLLDEPLIFAGESPSGIETIDPTINIYNIGKKPASDVKFYTYQFWVTTIPPGVKGDYSIND